MPEVDGIMLAQELRKRNPNCKVILMSANPEWKGRHVHGDGEDGIALLTKPFPLSQL